jgi:hypothetical protein
LYQRVGGVEGEVSHYNTSPSLGPAREKLLLYVWWRHEEVVENEDPPHLPQGETA